MSLTLASLPRELLASITALLPCFSSVKLLHDCGNRNLMAKLKTGGITTARFSGQQLTHGTLNFIETLALDSFSAEGFVMWSPIPIAHRLPRTLQSLAIPFRHLCPRLETAWMEGLPPSPSLPSATAEHVIWRIKDAYPHLTSLTVSGYESEEPLDPFETMMLLSGLPDSLTELIFPFAPECIDTARILPSHLTSLKLGHVTTKEHYNRFKNLERLKIVLPHASQPVFVSSQKYGGWSISNAAALCIPSSLTRLTLKCPETLALGLSSPLPNTLTQLSLTLSSADSLMESCGTPSNLLRLVPPSVSVLSVMANLRPDASPTGIQVALPAVNRFRMGMKCKAVHESSIAASLIRMLPTVEDFSLEISDRAEGGLGIEHLELFNGARLRSLSAPLSLQCLPLEEPYPLAIILPNLTSLTLARCMWSRGKWNPAYDLNFGAIPPSITFLSTGYQRLSTQYLHRLPLSVTTVTTDLAWHMHLPNIHHLLAPDCPDNHELAREGELKTLMMTFDHAIQRTSANRMLLVPNSARPAASLGFVGISWNTPPYHLFRSVTDLTLAAQVEVEADMLTQAKLPFLTKLRFESCPLSGDLDLQSFGTLLYLQWEDTYLPLRGSSCPPNLTVLRSRDEEIPESFLPLPQSLTWIETQHLRPVVTPDGGGPPLQLLAGLDMLHTLEICGYENVGNEWKGHLPSTLTYLNVESTFFQHFSEGDLRRYVFSIPSLTRLSIKERMSVAAAEVFNRIVPSGVTIEAELYDQLIDPASLARDAGVLPGHISMRHEYDLLEMAAEWVKRAYPRIKWKDSSFYSKLIPPHHWARFMPYLSPSVTSLELEKFSLLSYSETDVEWPPNLTEINLLNVSCQPHLSFTLPPVLKTFVLRRFSALGCAIAFNSLPRGLTRLEVPMWPIERVH